MIITRNHAQKLVKQGKAHIVGYVCQSASLSHYYAIVDRGDLQRTDHYYVRQDTPEYAECIGRF